MKERGGKWPECHPALQGGKCCLCGRDHKTAVVLDPVDTKPMMIDYGSGPSDHKHHRPWPNARRYKKERRACGDCLRVLVEKELVFRRVQRQPAGDDHK